MTKISDQESKSPDPMSTDIQQTNPKRKMDIHQRIFDFVARVLKLVQALPKTAQNLVLINQITRSATSIGANDQEADGSTSQKQFFHSQTITKKETKETNYWLRLISETNHKFKSRMDFKKPVPKEGFVWDLCFG